MSTLYKKRKLIAAMALLAATGISHADCTDPTNYRCSITSATVSALAAADFAAGSSLHMNFDSDLDTGSAIAWDWNAFPALSYYVTGASAGSVGGPLGSNGPLGAWGPLGANGPLFFGAPVSPINGVWPEPINPGFSNISGISLCSVDCYDQTGPLGQTGPLSPEAYYEAMPHLNEAAQENDFPAQLDASGVWGILGPLGPLGALGPLGPLGPKGPLGAFNISPNPNGNGDYVSNGVIQRAVTMVYGDTIGSYRGRTTSSEFIRRYDLFEIYTKARAQQFGTTDLTENDTSFGVNSPDIAAAGDSYLFTSKHDQWLSIVVVPGASVNSLETFNISLKSVAQTPAKTVLSTSNLSNYLLNGGLINFAMVRVKAGEKFNLTVSAPSGAAIGGYKLYVTGSGFDQKHRVNGSPGIWGDDDAFGPRAQKPTVPATLDRFNTIGKYQTQTPF